MIGHERGRPAPAARRGDRGGEGRDPRGARAPQAARRGLSPRGTLRVLPARRAGRDRQEHDGRRVRRPHRGRRHRADVPRARPARHRPRAARLHLPARARRRHRGDRAHPRPRGPRGRAALRAARARPHAADLRRAAHRRDGPLEARRAPAEGRRRWRTCSPPQTFEAGPVLGRDGQDGPLDPGLPSPWRSPASSARRSSPGDYKFDQTPVDGVPADVARLAELGREGLLLLCGDSTNADRPGHVAVRVERGAASSRRCSRAARAASSSPASPRTSTACSRWWTPPRVLGRKVSLVGRSMRKNVNIGRMLGHIDVPEGMLVGPKEIEDFPDHKLVVISTGSQGEPLSALRRMAHGDHPQGGAARRRHGDLLRHPDPGQRARGERDDRPHLPPRRQRDHRRRRARARLGPRLRGGAEADAQPDQAAST